MCDMLGYIEMINYYQLDKGDNMIGVIIVMFIIAGWQLPRIIKNNTNKEISTFIILWILISIYSSLVISDINLFNPIDFIIDYTQILTNYIY
jgi:hypothetical protein